MAYKTETCLVDITDTKDFRDTNEFTDEFTEPCLVELPDTNELLETEDNTLSNYNNYNEEVLKNGNNKEYIKYVKKQLNDLLCQQTQNEKVKTPTSGHTLMLYLLDPNYKATLTIVDLPEIDFDVFTTKVCLLLYWLINSVEDQPGTEIMTTDMYKNYTNYIQNRFPPQSVMTRGRFSRELNVALSVLRMKNTKIKKLEGRGYVGIGFASKEL